MFISKQLIFQNEKNSWCNVKLSILGGNKKQQNAEVKHRRTLFPEDERSETIASKVVADVQFTENVTNILYRNLIRYSTKIIVFLKQIFKTYTDPIQRTKLYEPHYVILQKNIRSRQRTKIEKAERNRCDSIVDYGHFHIFI